MLIDKDARLFGKINIIDFLIILVVIIAGLFLAYKLKDGKVNISTTETKTFEMDFYVESIEDFRVDAIEIGDNLYDDSKNIYLGKITNLNVKDSVEFNADREGNVVVSSKDGYSSLEITTEFQATPFESGVVISGNRYGIGHSLTIRAGKSFIYLRISGLEEKSGS